MSVFRLPGSDFRVLTSVLCLLTSGCGFHSVYGSHGSDGSPIAEQLNEVAIDPIQDRPGQMLRNDLIDGMYGKGRPSQIQPLYRLKVVLHIAEEDLGTLANATTSLAAVHADAEYTLTDAHDKVLTKGTAHGIASYDKLVSMYGTVAAHDSALERTIREAGEQIVAHVSLYFSEPPQP